MSHPISTYHCDASQDWNYQRTIEFYFQSVVDGSFYYFLLVSDDLTEYSFELSIDFVEFKV